MFTVNVYVTESKIAEAKRKIVENGGSIEGNEFEVSGVEGSIGEVHSSGRATISITDKPWLASQGYITSEIKKFFA